MWCRASSRGFALALVASGCTFNPPPLDELEPPSACGWDFVPAYVDPCLGPTPGAALVLGSPSVYTLDATARTLEGPQGPIALATTEQRGALVVWTSELEVVQEATLRLVGDRPVIVVANDGIRIYGEVDAASRIEDEDGFSAGAGANPASCDTPPAGAGNGVRCEHGGSGGGGGGLGANGGTGGIGGLTRNCGISPSGGAGGLMQDLPADLRGGCTGGTGAMGNGANDDAGVGGAGGGAIGLVADREITVNGTIHAGGAGGRPGEDDRASGGGGGSGGMIVLESMAIHVGGGAVIAANGGGGGGGCKDDPAAPGADAVAGVTGAAGGMRNGGGADAGGNGGAGGFASMPAVGGASAQRGGGGGGGSVGVIFVHAPAFSEDGTLSPDPRLKSRASPSGRLTGR